MASIRILMKDGTTREFPHEGRAGGSYSKSVKFEGNFVVITDEWDNRTAFPAEDVAEVQERPTRGCW
jgi:hypothetical protein